MAALVEALERAPDAVLAFSDAVVVCRTARVEDWVRTTSFTGVDGLAYGARTAASRWRQDLINGGCRTAG